MLCSLLVVFGLQAQKKLNKTVQTDNIDLIQVNSNNCYWVELNTESSNEICIQAEIEGEYTQDLDLEVTVNGATLMIEAGFIPSFENPNDKLSAHKVVSILLKITLPLFKDVDLYGTNSRVVINGTYSDVSVSLSDGNCELLDLIGNANIKTQSGLISVKSKAAHIDAKSKYGRVDMNVIPPGTSFYKLETVTGNIELSKTE